MTELSPKICPVCNVMFDEKLNSENLDGTIRERFFHLKQRTMCIIDNGQIIGVLEVTKYGLWLNEADDDP